MQNLSPTPGPTEADYWSITCIFRKSPHHHWCVLYSLKITNLEIFYLLRLCVTVGLILRCSQSIIGVDSRVGMWLRQSLLVAQCRERNLSLELAELEGGIYMPHFLPSCVHI
jgi:hypothetical protein